MGAVKRYQEGWIARRNRPPTPLRLKRVLADSGISQARLAVALGLSGASMAQIVNRDIWPSTPAREVLSKRIRECLRLWGAVDEDVEMACEIDDDPNQPRSTGQGSPRPARAIAPIADWDKPLPEAEMLTQAARRHFSLFRDPFLDDVQGPDDVFLAEEQRYIREYLFTTAKHGGFVAVIGESGAGKSVLRRDLIDRIRREGHPITYIMPRIIDKQRLTAGAICDAIVEDLSQERPRKSLESKGRQVERLLLGSSHAGNSHVLLIEEAHDLTVQTLKYLKRFWELEDGFKKLLGIILIGQPELRAKLDERQNWEAREVIRRCEVAELGPLGKNLEAYLELKLKRVGKQAGEVFEPNAYDAMRERLMLRHRTSKDPVSMTYPLVVNNLVVRCMNLAVEVGATRVSAEIVQGV